jgi:hypothetical protein
MEDYQGYEDTSDVPIWILVVLGIIVLFAIGILIFDQSETHHYETCDCWECLSKK